LKIFKTINLKNDRVYIGFDENNNQNFLGSGNYISKAIEIFGPASFKREDLIEISPDWNQDQILQQINFYIKKFNSDHPKNGYNERTMKINNQNKLNKKIQVLMSESDMTNLESIIIEEGMENDQKPKSTSLYVRNVLIDHIKNKIKE